MSVTEAVVRSSLKNSITSNTRCADFTICVLESCIFLFILLPPKAKSTRPHRVCAFLTRSKIITSLYLNTGKKHRDAPCSGDKASPSSQEISASCVPMRDAAVAGLGDRTGDMDWTASALRERLTIIEPVSLIHGNYGNHNVIADSKQPGVAAILDWEMSTIGNPLVDLAHAMRPWMEPPEPEAGCPTLADKGLTALEILRSRSTKRKAAFRGPRASSTLPSSCFAPRQ